MKRKLNKWLSGVLAACVLFTTVPVYAINNISGTETSTEVVETSEETQSSEIETSSTEETNQESSESTENTSETSSEESSEEQTSKIANEMINISPTNLGDEDEPSTDNWELSTVFYDSTVDNGKTPLTCIDWDASDGGYGVGETRVITVQINYKNTNAVTTYQPGDLEISIPNLSYGTNSSNNAQWSTKIIVGANDSTHTGYAWDFTTGKNPTTSQKTYTFANANIIEEKSNFEGSIQIAYTITPQTETPEEYIDDCTHSFSQSLQAKLNDIIQSNQIAFNYKRIYIHPWEKETYTLNKSTSKISSLDSLPSDANDYIWVIYNFSIKDEHGLYNISDFNQKYPYRTVREMYVKDEFPKDCIVIDKSTMEILTPEENNIYHISISSFRSSTSKSIIVGYPQSIYNGENANLSVTNRAELYGLYRKGNDYEYLDESSVSLNLDDFHFQYSGNLYRISKSAESDNFSDGRYNLSYQDIKNGWDSRNFVTWKIFPYATYTGSPMTVKIGDDLLYAIDRNGDYTKLNDNEYYFTYISMPTLYNLNDIALAKDKYKCELWIRYANSKEYSLYEEFTNTNRSWTFTKEDHVVGFYIIIYDLTESLKISSSTFNATTRFFKPDIPESGTIYNFAFLQIFFRDTNGNLVLQNEPDRDSYASYITQEIADYDLENYDGHYLQRATYSRNWKYRNIVQPVARLTAIKSVDSINDDAENELFFGTCTIGAGIYGGRAWEPNYFEQYDSSYLVEGWTIYDLLPQGMELVSDEKDILNSFYKTYFPSSSYKFYDINGQEVSSETFLELLQQNIEITIDDNWNNTQRTRISINIDFSEKPMYITNPTSTAYGSSGNTAQFNFKYDYIISYDSFLEYGNIYDNYCYAEKIGESKGITVGTQSFSATPDNGFYDKDATDIDEDGDITEYLAYQKATVTITSVISTHQDVQMQVQTANNNYTVGKGTSPYGENYTYKLRVRTGQNAATNMVIANNLEMAFNNKKYWQGEFLGVDTSYIENKTFYVYDPSNPNADNEGNVAEKVKVKIYYSENPEETNLYLTEMTQVIEDGNEVSKEVFVTDSDGNILKNTNWKEYTDDVDKSSVKSLAFELLNAETGEPAVIPANSLVYVLVTMKSPEDPYLNEDVNEEDRPLANDIKTFAYNSCWTQWTAIDSFGQEVDFVTGINSNIVKVALPYSVDTDELPTVTLKFIKEISGTDSDFENMLLDKAAERNFKITLTSLTANEDGSYNQITGLLSSTQGLTLSKVPIGTYLITESDDIYFDFVEMIPNNDSPTIEGVTLEKTDKGYVLTISDDLSGDVEFNIKVTNKIEPDRPYEDKEEIENLFKIPSVDA